MKKNKEHKKGESTIGKIIYGFLLFMPLFAIGVTCGYAMFNKNAYQSYDTPTDEYTQATELEVGKNYYFFSMVTGNVQDSFSRINCTNFRVINTTTTQLSIETLNQTNNFTLSTNGTDITFYRDTTNLGSIYMGSVIINFTYDYLGIVDNTQIKTNKLLNHTYIANSTYNPISNVFYYAIDKVTESPLFSWATNSVIYTTMNATCTQLSIAAPFIPLLLTYWLIISVIYFLYDIALMLIWLLHDKIHEMRDSLA